MRLLRSVWQDIRSGENLDVYVTVIIAVLVAILSIFELVDQTIVLSTVLATLALVSVALLRNRHADDEIRTTLARIEVGEDTTEQRRIEYDLATVRDLVGSARKAYFWGLTFTRTIPALEFAFEQGLRTGLELKILILKPDSAAAELAAFGTRYAGVEEENQHIRATLTRLARIARDVPSGNLEVRVINYLPHWTMISFDPHLPNGRMFIRLVGFRIPNELRPSYELTNSGGNTLFQFYLEQFEEVWQEAEPVDLQEYTKDR